MRRDSPHPAFLHWTIQLGAWGKKYVRRFQSTATHFFFCENKTVRKIPMSRWNPKNHLSRYYNSRYVGVFLHINYDIYVFYICMLYGIHIVSKEMCNYVCISIHFARCWIYKLVLEKIGDNDVDFSQRGMTMLRKHLKPLHHIWCSVPRQIQLCHQNIASLVDQHRICRGHITQLPGPFTHSAT